MTSKGYIFLHCIHSQILTNAAIMITRAWTWKQTTDSNPQAKEKTIVKDHSPVLDRRTVLLDHLVAVLDSTHLKHQGKQRDRICQELQACSDGELLEMLCDQDKLETFIGTIENEPVSTATQTNNQNLELIGNLLFDKVSKIETELCAQITGMILEMEPALIKALLADNTALKAAVTKAKQEYIMANFPDRLWPETNIADEVYIQVQKIYPLNAPQITGMLLELPESHLQVLLRHPKDLSLKVEEAKLALEKVGKWMLE